MAELGIVSVIADQTAYAAVGPTWAAAVKALSPKLSFVRGSISGDIHGNVQVELLRRGLRAFRNAGLSVHAIIEANLAHPWLNPNDYLGYQGDFLKNEWIENQTERAIRILTLLGDDAPSVIYWGNEPNSQAALNPLGTGEVIPVLNIGEKANRGKPAAISPSAYFAGLYHAAYWIRKKVPRVQTIYPAALSCFVAFNTSMEDDWIGQYYASGVKYLTDHNLRSPWPWSNIALTLEGLVTPNYATYVRNGVDTIQRNIGGTAGLVVSEWGVPASSPGKPLNVPAMTTACHAIAEVAHSMAFFSAHVTGGYGIFPIVFKNGEILPGTPTDWVTALPAMLNGLP